MLKKCLSKYKKLITLYLFNGIIEIFISTLAVVYFQKLLDSIGVGKSWPLALGFLLAFGVFQFTSYLLSYVDNYPYSILRNGFYYELKLIAMKKISTIKYLHYKNIGTGELIQLVENGADAGQKILFDFYLNVFRNILPSLIIGMAFIGFYDYNVLLGIILSYVFVFLITKLLLKRLYNVKNKILISEEKFTSRTVRAFMEMVVFRTNRRYKNEIEKNRKRANEIIRAKTKIYMTHELFFTSFVIIVGIIKVFAIYIGMKQIFEGSSSIGTIVALITLIDRVYEPIAIFNVEYVDLKLNRLAFKRFKSLMEKPDDEKIYSGKEANISQGNITLKNISYKYNDDVILNEISLNLCAGKSYALVGLSGTGKTTILNLLAGLLKPDDGKIMIDGQDLLTLNLDSYYKHTAYLSQSPSIFHGSVHENLSFDKKVSDDILWDALEKANLFNRVKSMENGLDENVGERGNRLSGGEKQRLALARTIVMQPKIVILDESTSALDSINEERVIKNLFAALGSSTVIAVTHRVHTTHRFDNVILMDEGSIKAQGSMEELLKNDILFRRIYEADRRRK